ncbi:MAG: hypothetical protein ACI83D_000395 [Planctomycetota bacterium]|jgi:hypothetical protein
MQVIVTVLTRWLCMVSVPAIVIIHMFTGVTIVELHPYALIGFAVLLARCIVLPLGLVVFCTISGKYFSSCRELTFPEKYHLPFVVSTYIATIPLSIFLYQISRYIKILDDPLSQLFCVCWTTLENNFDATVTLTYTMVSLD